MWAIICCRLGIWITLSMLCKYVSGYFVHCIARFLSVVCHTVLLMVISILYFLSDRESYSVFLPVWDCPRSYGHAHSRWPVAWLWLLYFQQKASLPECVEDQESYNWWPSCIYTLSLNNYLGGCSFGIIQGWGSTSPIQYYLCF